MTLREILQNKTRRNLKIGLYSWLAFAGSIVVASQLGVRLLPLLFFVPFIGAVSAQMFFVRCPRCNGNIGQIMTQTLAPPKLRTSVTHCPYCGVNFDKTGQ